MSGYIAQLMRQTGVKVADANNVSVAPPATEVQEITFVSQPEVSGKEVQGESVADQDQPVVRPPSHGEPDPIQPASEVHRGNEKGSESRVPRQLADGTPFISIAQTEPRSTSEPEAPRANTAPPSTQPEIVHEVMTWLADSGGTSRPARITSDASPSALPVQTAEMPLPVRPHLSDNTSASPTTDDSLPEQVTDSEIVAFAAAHPLTLPSPRKDEPWSVHIDTIQLTIEEPAATRTPPPVAPSAARPAQPQISPSRLRRHYLRTF